MRDRQDPPRRVIRVYCALCGVFIRKMVTACVRVTDTCLTCVYHETGGHYANPR